MKYQIKSYQIVYANGNRDSVSLLSPIIVADLEAFRLEKKLAYNCSGVNLTYVELNED